MWLLCGAFFSESRSLFEYKFHVKKVRDACLFTKNWREEIFFLEESLQPI